MDKLIKGVKVTSLKIIKGSLGDVMQALKKSDAGFKGFGEAYFSTVKKDCVKGWKMHRLATLNMVVPVGEIKFVLFDNRPESKSYGVIQEVVLSQGNYCRLTVPPMVWVAFEGIGEFNMLLDVVDMEHDDNEAENLDLEKVDYHDW